MPPWILNLKRKSAHSAASTSPYPASLMQIEKQRMKNGAKSGVGSTSP